MKSKLILIPVISLLGVSLVGCQMGNKQENLESATIKEEDNDLNTNTEDNLKMLSSEVLKDYLIGEDVSSLKYKGSGFGEFSSFETVVRNSGSDYTDIINLKGTAISKKIKLNEDGLIISRLGTEDYLGLDYSLLEEVNEVLLAKPLEVGNSWVSGDKKKEIVSVDEILETDIGPLSTIKVVSLNNENLDKEVFYFSKGLGLVKYELTTKDGLETSSVIEEVVKGEDYNTSVELFTLDSNAENIISTNASVKLRKNKDINNQILETYSNKAPEIISENTQINEVKIDGDTLIIDFNDAFKDEMNAGANIEYMILESVANTFGNIYNKNKVMITVSGDMYSSGHILLEEPIEL